MPSMIAIEDNLKVRLKVNNWVTYQGLKNGFIHGTVLAASWVRPVS